MGTIGAWVYLAGFSRQDLRIFLHRIGLRANGHIYNRSSQPLWVIVTSPTQAFAYRLAPNHKSPDSLDADAVKSTNGTSIESDTTWYKVLDGATGEVRDAPSGLQIDCLLCYPVHYSEFNPVIYSDSTKWGTYITPE